MLGSFSWDSLSYWISDQDSDKMLGDQFGLRKIMVIVTSNGKVSKYVVCVCVRVCVCVYGSIVGW